MLRARTMTANEIPGSRYSDSEYFLINICAYGCKWLAAKNEGMAETGGRRPRALAANSPLSVHSAAQPP